MSSWLVDLYAEGSRDFFDAVALHPYSKHGVNWQGIRDMFDVLDHFGDSHKPVWINEFGWDTTDEVTKSRYLTDALEKIRTPPWKRVKLFNYLVLSDLSSVSPQFPPLRPVN